jgi:hypothetical protein
MTVSRSLPARPSLESLRKQAKRLLREVTAGSADAIARVRAQCPDIPLPLSHRDAQLVIAREYGFSGWQDLSAEVLKRLGRGVEWAAGQAERLIHDNDATGLKGLLAEYPALLAWRSEHVGLLAIATEAYGDSFDPARERTYTRHECAELLIDAGAVVDESIYESLIVSRARGMLQLYDDKGLLPQTLKFFAALGDLSRVRACFDRQGRGSGPDAAVGEAFIVACRFEHEAIATFLLDRCTAFDPELGRRIDGGPGRAVLVRYLIEEHPLNFIRAAPEGPWQAFLMHQVVRCIHEDDLTTFEQLLRQEAWLLEDSSVAFQVGLVERATLRFAIAERLLEHGADINTQWSSHEPASLLHELVFRGDYPGMQFLIDRGIDMTILDYRWSATAEGWARHGANNEKMGDWLEEAARHRSHRE